MQPTPTRVLLVDDDQGDFEMIRVMLSQVEHARFRVDWVATFEEALDAFEKEEHDVYFIDYFLEDRTGLELLKEARRRGIAAPVIMLTGRGSRAVDQEALEAGAADYLVKGLIDPPALERSIRHATERTKAARALQQSEERHRSMFEHLPVGLYRTAPDGAFMDANAALVRILGYPDRDSLDHRYSRDLYVHPDDREVFRDLLDRQGVVRAFESTLRRPDGTSIRVRNTARLHRNDKGEVLYLEGVLEEASQAGTAEAEPPAGGRSFLSALEASPSPMALLDTDGRVLDANPAFLQLFSPGGKDDDLHFGDLLDPSDRLPFQRELRGLTQGERTSHEAEKRFLSREGSLFWARVGTITFGGGEDQTPHVLVSLEVRP